MKKTILSVIGILTCLVALAQPTGLSVEYYQVHYGEVNGVDLDGYVTYHVFLEMTNEDDFLSAIYAFLGVDENPDSEDIEILTDCACYNNDDFGVFSGGINSALIPTFPELDFDTFWTIGKQYISEPGEVSFVVANPNPFDDSDPCEAWIDDGALFSTFGQPNAFAGPDERLLILQITTCSEEFCVDFCTQTFVDGVQADQDFTCFDPVCFQNPCSANPLPADISVVDEILCQGQEATIEVNPGGNGDVTYELFTIDGNDALLVASQTGDPLFDGVEAGDYFIAMTDDVGCRDTIADISFTDPPGLNVSVELTADNVCGDENTAEICPTINGGQPPYTIELIAADGSSQSVNEGECFSGVACVNGDGTFTVVVSDQSGCTFEEDIAINCPEAMGIEVMVDPIFCNGDGNAEINFDVTGGTGAINVSLDVPDFTFDAQEAPFTEVVSDVAPGNYTLTLTDANDCVLEETIQIIEPDPLDVAFDATDIACFGNCDGVISADADGGTPPYTLTVTDGDGNAVDEEALCAGTYTATITDDNDCQVSETLEIIEPDEITFEIASSDISCFGAGDGQICVTNVAGGTGQVQWAITSPPSEATDPGTTECFDMLSADTYVITFSDEAGCEITETGIVLNEPEELTIVTNVNGISCFGFNDGSVEVSATGGTGQVSLTAPEAAPLPYTVADLLPGEVTLVIQDETGCEDSETITIEEPISVEIEVLAVNDISCGGNCNGAVELDLSGGTGELALFLNGEPSVPTGLCAGEYEAIVVDENLCQDTAFFEIIQPDPIEFLIDVDNVTCTGMNDGSVNVFPTGGQGDITWEVLQDVDINNLFEGTYTISGVDSTGCTADTTFTVNADITADIEVEIFTSQVTCWNESDGTATAAVTGGSLPINYTWNDPNGQTTATAVGLSEGVYSVTVTDAIGCTLSFLAEVEPTPGCFFIADVLTPNGDGANDEWIIGGLEFFPNSMVQVYNRWGQLLFESRGYNTRWDGMWNGRQLPVADYYYVITYDETQDPITGTVTIKY